VYVGRAIFLAHLAEKTGKNSGAILQYLVPCPHQDIPEEQPGQQVDPYGAEGGAGAAVDAGGGVKIIRKLHFMEKFSIDF
jgi:hypothetical protein